MSDEASGTTYNRLIHGNHPPGSCARIRADVREYRGAAESGCETPPSGLRGRVRRCLQSPYGLPPSPPNPDLAFPPRHSSCDNSPAIKCPRKPWGAGVATYVIRLRVQGSSWNISRKNPDTILCRRLRTGHPIQRCNVVWTCPQASPADLCPRTSGSSSRFFRSAIRWVSNPTTRVLLRLHGRLRSIHLFRPELFRLNRLTRGTFRHGVALHRLLGDLLCQLGRLRHLTISTGSGTDPCEAKRF